MTSFQSNAPIPNNLYTTANGTASSTPFITVLTNRNPTSNDVQYNVKQRWINTTNATEWILTGFTSVSGVTTANWFQLSDGDALVQFTGGTGTTGFPVSPNSSGQVQLTSNDLSIAISGSTNSINFDINYSTNLWTPSVSIGGTPLSGSDYTSSGGFTNLLNLVFLWFDVSFSSLGGLSGDITITNLPFAASVNGRIQNMPIANFNGVTAAGYTTVGLILNNTSTIANFLISSASGSTTRHLAAADISSTSYFQGNLFYITD